MMADRRDTPHCVRETLADYAAAPEVATMFYQAR